MGDVNGVVGAYDVDGVMMSEGMPEGMVGRDL